MTLAARIGPDAAALDAAMARLRPVAPQAAERAERALAVALAPTHRSRWPELAWQASRLTNTGYPVELAWSSRDPSIRWTAEAAGPDTPEAERLPAALEVLRRLGGGIAVPDWMARQPGQALRFGAWIGGRHNVARDAYKLYIDLAGTEPPPDLLPSAVVAAMPRRIVWRMAGLGAGAGQVELYGRLPRPEAWEVTRMLDRCGIEPAAVVRLATEATGRTGEDLPRTAGLSLAFVDGRPTAAGLFFPAGLLLGSDPAISAALRAIALRQGWDMAIYEAVLGHVGNDGRSRHGMIGIGADADGAAWMQVGLRP
jgi:hypothetical protein